MANTDLKVMVEKHTMYLRRAQDAKDGKRRLMLGGDYLEVTEHFTETELDHIQARAEKSLAKREGKI
jgi:hypothetical protein